MAWEWEKIGRRVDWLIRGHFLASLLAGLGLGKVVEWLVLKYANVPHTLAVAIWLLASSAIVWLFLFVVRFFQRREPSPQSPTTQSVLNPNPENVKQALEAPNLFYANCNGPFLQEMETYIVALSQKKEAKDREQFFVRLISAGIVSYLHDVTWAYIFGSQIKALQWVNENGLVSIESLRHFYDETAKANPKEFTTFTFDMWLQYFRTNTLLKLEGANAQITVRGKDFLKYIVNQSWSPSTRSY